MFVNQWIVLRPQEAKYIKANIIIPKKVESLIKIPKIRPKPIPKRPSIKIISTNWLPAKEWKNSANGPRVANFKKPKVGEPPFSQAFDKDNPPRRFWHRDKLKIQAQIIYQKMPIKIESPLPVLKFQNDSNFYSYFNYTTE